MEKDIVEYVKMDNLNRFWKPFTVSMRNGKVKFTFGKYKGIEILKVKQNDFDYIQQLINCPHIKKEFRKVLQHIS